MRHSPLRRKPKPSKQPDELEAMAEFKAAAEAQGCCQVCGGPADVAHHVVTQNHVRRENGDPWDVRNVMCLCSGPAGCHDAHHARMRPIPLSAVPEAALEFAHELLGPERAEDFWARYYGPPRRVGY